MLAQAEVDPRKLVPVCRMLRVKGENEDTPSKGWYTISLRVVEIHPSIFISVEDFPRGSEEFDILRGNIFVCNMKLTQSFGDPADAKVRNFTKFRTMYAALRGLRGVPDRYNEIEIPALQEWNRTVGLLTVKSYGLHEATPEEIALYEAERMKAAAPHLYVVDDDKVAALQQTLSASHKDKRGRRNNTRLPLKWNAAKASLRARIRAARTIAGFMDSRVLALAMHIDEVYRVLDEVSVKTANLLSAAWAFGDKPNASKIRRQAETLPEYADPLESVHSRPFGPRSVHRIADDLRLVSAHFMVGAMEEGKGVLRRIERCLYILDVHRELEEILFLLHAAQFEKTLMNDAERLSIIEELDEIATKVLSREDLDHDFKVQILHDAHRHTRVCIKALTEYPGAPKQKLGVAHESLRDACAGF